MTTRRRRRQRRSYAYQEGYGRAMECVERHGRVQFTPSIADRDEFRHEWAGFMRGWNDALRQAARE